MKHLPDLAATRSQHPQPQPHPQQPTEPPQPKPNLTRPEAAAYLGVKPQTLSSWACNKSVNLPYVKAGRRVLYRLSDLQAYCAANLVGHSNVGVAK